MNRIQGIFSTALAVLALPAAAQSQLGWFGLADAGVSVNQPIGGGPKKSYLSSGSMTTSTLGLRGSEDLGAGASAFFEVSSFLSLKTGAIVGGTAQQNTYGRSAFVGVASSTLGALDVGRNNNPSFLPTLKFNAYGNSGGWGPLWHATYFNFTQFATFAGVDGLIHDTAWDRQVHYASPELGGSTTVHLHYAPGGLAGQRKVANWGANILYQRGPLGLASYYQHTALESSGAASVDLYSRDFQSGTVRVPANSPARSYFAGASYNFGVLKAFATWQRSRQQASGIGARTAQFSVSIPAGPGKVLAEYARTAYQGPAATAALLQEGVVGYDYSLSRRTDVYANYLRSKTSQYSAAGYTAGVGIRHQF